ncbi:MAG TPA: hypothetical protein VIY48_09520 [Candidatus Paceibacterota bacterium]
MSEYWPPVLSSSSFYHALGSSSWMPLDHIAVAQIRKRGIDMQTLFDVFLVYGEDRIAPLVTNRRVVACNEEEAKLKSKISEEIKDDWDIDFVTIVVRQIGSVAIKERPQEVKSV